MAEDSVRSKSAALRMRRSILIVICFAAVLWLIKIAETVFMLDLGRYGVLPRELMGLRGVLCAPLIHGSWSHLVANTGPLCILGTALLYGYPKSARIVLPIIYFGVGLIVWLFARPVYHIGASGLTFGMMFFISVLGVLRKDKQAIALALVVFFLYGGMMGGLLPTQSGISYETHLAAAGLGVLAAFWLSDLDPPPPRKQYSWELEDELEDVLEEELEQSERAINSRDLH